MWAIAEDKIIIYIGIYCHLYPTTKTCIIAVIEERTKDITNTLSEINFLNTSSKAKRMIAISKKFIILLYLI